VLKSAGSNVPRVEWVDTDSDGTRDTPTLLLEGARTNGFTYSEQLDNGGWSKTRSSITTNAIAAPDGASTADKIVEDSTAADDHRLWRGTPTLTDDTVSTVSLFAKAGERTWLAIRTLDKSSTTRDTWFDLSNGVLGTKHAAHTASIESVGNGWYRIAVAADFGNGVASPDIRIELSTGDGVIAYNGDGSSGLYVWGIQFETDQPFASSYIQTVASTVTRNADAMYFDWPFPPQEMTVYGHVVGYNGGDNNNKLFQIGHGNTDKPLLQLYINNSHIMRVLYQDGVTSAETAATLAALSTGDDFEFRATLSAAGVIQCHQSINAGSEASSAAAAGGALPAAWAGTRFYIGAGGDGNAPTGLNWLVVKASRGTKTMAQMRAL